MLNEKQFFIQLDSQHRAAAIRVPKDITPEAALELLKLPPHRGVVVMHGGAARMEPDVIDRVRRFLALSLAPSAEKLKLAVFDGGTSGGSFLAMGEARRQVKGTYPLVGICPWDRVGFPGGPPLTRDRYPLDRTHSHFILVEDGSFGVESALLVGMLRGSGKPGLALIINGGEIALQEAQLHAAQGETLVVVRGSGRTADELAQLNSPERATLPSGTRVEVVDIDRPQQFTALLERTFRA